jgi:hypothetical protein
MKRSTILASKAGGRQGRVATKVTGKGKEIPITYRLVDVGLESL